MKMSNEEYTEVTSTSWFARIGNSLKGILLGLVLVVVSFVVLFWNEGRTVKQYKTLKEGAGKVISVPADKVDPANSGKLVHVTGRASTGETLRDDAFGISGNAIKLERSVQMYQWKEESKSESRKKLGGGEETKTTYSYSQDWEDRPIDSSTFKQRNGHENPGKMPIEGKTWSASHVTLGAFTLSPDLVQMINTFDALPVNDPAPAVQQAAGVEGQPAPAPAQGGRKVFQGGYYFGDDPARPKTGDIKVSFSVVRPLDVSVIAAQRDATFAPFKTSAGGAIEMLDPGTKSATEMFEGAQAGNTMLAWILRIGGFVLMFIGFSMILKPLSVIADIVPFIGSLIGAGTGFVAFVVSLILSLITIAIAWIFFRPLVAVVLLLLAGGGIYLLARRRKSVPEA